jgi:transposase
MTDYFLGCDVSKGYADFTILDSKKHVVEPDFQLDDTFDGHSCLCNVLERFFKAHPDSTLYAAVESTGGYENNWLNLFYRLGGLMNVKAARLNPVGVHAYNKASLNRNVNDSISAKNIAGYLISYPEKVSYSEEEDTRSSLRKQWNFIAMLKKQRTQLSNQLGFHIYAANTGILKYCKNGLPRWVLYLLKRYPTSLKLSKARVSSVSKIPYISQERARDLILAARKSIASSGDEVTEFLIKETVKQIINLGRSIELQEKYLEKHCDIPEVKILTSFKGIGPLSAVGLSLNIVTIERFPTVKRLTSFFGLHPVYKESGDGMWGFHMSKQGRVEPRAILFMAARSAINSNPLIKEIYIKHVQRGMSKMAALGVCMHKILRIVYGMLKNQKAFDPEIDRKNSCKMLSIKKTRKSKKGDTKRRYQKQDNSAPVSRRQGVKRKERKESQSNNVTKNGIITPLPSIQEAIV